MLKLISKEHRPQIVELFANAQKNVNIISPFIGMDMANLLCQCLANNNQISCKIITRFYREDFISGVSDLRALKKLVEAGVDIYLLNKLHTKLYLFDKSTAMIGSANFTSGGFRFNHELSLMIKEETKVLAEIQSYFDDLVEQIELLGEFKLTLERIQSEIKETNRLRDLRTDSKTTFKNNTKFGADIDQTLITLENENITDPIQHFIIGDSKKSIEGVGPNIWLKFEGEASSRFSVKERYSPTITNKFKCGITCFPDKNQRLNIADNDYIYLALVSRTDQGTPVSPIIVGRGITEGYKEKNFADDSMKKKYTWMEHYPLFCVYKEFEYLDTEIENGIPLAEVLSKVGSKTYISSCEENCSLQELMKVHYQKAYITLTNDAKKYIDEVFDQLVRKYGSIRLSETNSTVDLDEKSLLEKKFRNKIMNSYKMAQKDLNYNPKLYIQMIEDKGAVEAAKALINKPKVSLGFEKLWEKKRLDLSLEAAVLNEEYHTLFTAEEIEICRSRLEGCGYKID